MIYLQKYLRVKKEKKIYISNIKIRIIYLVRCPLKIKEPKFSKNKYKHFKFGN